MAAREIYRSISLIEIIKRNKKNYFKQYEKKFHNV